MNASLGPLKKFALVRSNELIALSILVRLALVIYGSWQDERFEVKYSDIDYAVVTDGARRVLEGESPYDRATYRYSPLLAYLLTPNIFAHASFGKLVFVGFDALCGFLVLLVMHALEYDVGTSRLASLAWLWNPLSLTISTRGSGDSIVCAQVLVIILGLINSRTSRRPWLCLLYSAVAHGLSVHWRLFPIIFAPTILVFLDSWAKRIFYGFVSGFVFLALGLVFYATYGEVFLQETFMYHLGRTDHRHNFSVWFYALYLSFDANSIPLLSLAAFLPQLVTQASLIIRFAKEDVTYAFFLQTWAFVAFNKVVTAQYFLWYVSLLPITFFSTSYDLFSIFVMILFPWVLTELHWLFWAFLVEFEGRSFFRGIFSAGVLFFGANVYSIASLVRAHKHRELETKPRGKMN